VLIATPEYNYSVPGVLKNAIDWASRPYGKNSFRDKTAAVISASPGSFGGVGAQYQLKQVLVALETHLVTQPAVILTGAHLKFNEGGELVDVEAKKFLAALLQNLVELTRRLKRTELAQPIPVSS
jgi:chromate reductase